MSTNTVFHYTGTAGMRSQSLTIVLEPGGELFVTARCGDLSAFVDLPAAHKGRLYEWLKADIEGGAAEAKARAEGRLVVRGATGGLRLVPAPASSDQQA